MTSKDTRAFLTTGGYLQKGKHANLNESEIQKEVLDLLPGRQVESRLGGLYIHETV